MRDYLLIYVNGRRYKISGKRGFQSLSDFLRYDLGMVGTKVVCAEGDCGSCTVLIGESGTLSCSMRELTVAFSIYINWIVLM